MSWLRCINHRLPDWMRADSLWKWLPRTLLFFYYPLLYLEDLISQIYDPALDDQSFWCTPKTGLIVLIPLVYYFLSKHMLIQKVLTGIGNSTASSSTSSNPPQEKNKELDESPDFELRTSLTSGLSHDEVKARAEQFGKNEIRLGKTLIATLRQFVSDPARLLIQSAILLALTFRQWQHVLPLYILLALEATDILMSRKKVNDVVRPFAWKLAQQAIVLRDGTVCEIPFSDLVPGDIVHVSAESFMPADALVVDLTGTLEVNESSITGEHNLVYKSVGDLCYATTRITRGEAFLEIRKTGMETFVGRTMALLHNDGTPLKDEPPHVIEYKTVLRSIGRTTMGVVATSMLCSLAFFNSKDRSDEILAVLCQIGVLMASSSMIGGTKTCQAVGNGTLASEFKCIVQQYDASDALAGVDILCTDRTGTLTENQLTVAEPFCLSSTPEELMLVARLSGLGFTDPDPIDYAVARALKGFPQAKAEVDRYRCLDAVPFDPETKVMHCLVESPLGELVICLKGAPKAVMERYFPVHEDKEDMRQAYRDACVSLASRGFRSLGVARQRENEEWEPLGVLPLFDPPRFDTRHAIEAAENLGIEVRFMAGDASHIAGQFAEQIGMRPAVVVGEQIEEANSKGPASSFTDIANANVYAEISAEHKEKLVKILQNRGHRVALGGDGLLDAPSLSSADCGLAMEGASETAQRASNMVFLKPGLYGIVQSVRTCRQIFQQRYTCLMQHHLQTLHVILVIVWNFAICRDILSMRFLLISKNLVDLGGMFVPTSCLATPYSRRPARWSYRKLVVQVIPCVMVLTLGTVVSIGQTRVGDDQPLESTLSGPQLNTTSTRAQALSLHIILSNFWMSSVMHTDGRPWAYYQNYRLIFTKLCIHALMTVTCTTGFAGERYHIDTFTTIWVWSTSFIFSVLAAAVYYGLSDGDLVDAEDSLGLQIDETEVDDKDNEV